MQPTRVFRRAGCGTRRLREVRLEIADDDVLRAIADQAERINQTIRSIVVFDGTMRGAAARRGE
jgi:hypothetical protein